MAAVYSSAAGRRSGRAGGMISGARGVEAPAPGLQTTEGLSMKVAAAFDHRGVSLREAILEALADEQVIDLGTDTDAVRVDYPDKARQVGEAIQAGDADRGIIVCGSGAGAAIAACKLSGIRAAICHDLYSAHQAVEHDDLNVLCLGSEIIGAAVARELVAVFLAARFDGGARYVARLEKVAAMERGMTHD